VLQVKVTRESGPPALALPVIDIPGYTSQLHESTADSAGYVYTDPGGAYLAASSRFSVPRRIVSLRNLDVLELENAWAGASVARNEIIGGLPANPAFVYQTPLVRFVDVLTPLLTPAGEWDLSVFTPGPPPHPLSLYLKDFLAAFFKASADRTIKLGCTFRYLLNGLPVELPVLLTTPFAYTAGEYATLADFIVNWFGDHGLTGKSGDLLFDLSVFASLTTSQLPLLQLRLTLKTGLIEWPPT